MRKRVASWRLAATTMKYKVSVAAAQDIKSIYRQSTLKFGPVQADRYYDGLIRTVQAIADRPLAVRERPELRRGIRIQPYQSHLVLFRVLDTGILIVRVLHSRQDIERNL